MEGGEGVARWRVLGGGRWDGVFWEGEVGERDVLRGRKLGIRAVGMGLGTWRAGWMGCGGGGEEESG